MLGLNILLWETSKGTPLLTSGESPITPYSGFTPGTLVFTYYTSARRRYAPHDSGIDKQQ